jgi:GT2 family glycosyltransferase
MEDAALNPWFHERWSISEEKLLSPLPKITIGILSYNRKNNLRRTLDCMTKAVQYPDREIIVVDNASQDGSAEMVQNEFPAVKIIRVDANIGAAARNYFYNEAKGKYVFSYDDDSYPATPSTIFDVVLFLEAHSYVDAISFFCYQPLTGFAESGELEKFCFSGSEEKGYEGLYFVEGGMCIRKQAWEKISGYDPDFHWGAEGADLTLQMYRENMRTLYHKSFATLHMKSEENRNISKNIYFFTRNYLWTIAKHFPFYAAIPLSLLYIIRRTAAMILHPNLAAAYLKGITDSTLGFFVQRKKCKKLSLRQVLGLKRWYLFLFRW